jgi:hypothetical protein
VKKLTSCCILEIAIILAVMSSACFAQMPMTKAQKEDCKQAIKAHGQEFKQWLEANRQAIKANRIAPPEPSDELVQEACGTPEEYAAIHYDGPPPADYDRVGRIVSHEEEWRNLLDDISKEDLYYDGDYICIQGDAHHAPQCDKREDWIVRKSIAYDETLLDDGSVLTVPVLTHGEMLSGGPNCGLDLDKKCSEPWKHTEKTRVLKPNDGLLGDLQLAVIIPKDGQRTIRYSVDRGGHICVWRYPSLDAKFYRERREARAKATQ